MFVLQDKRKGEGRYIPASDQESSDVLHLLERHSRVVDSLHGTSRNFVDKLTKGDCIII
jgi:hypothetical protein